MYDYDMLMHDVEEMNPITTENFSIGKSVMGRDLICLKIGRGDKKLVVNGAHHGLEYITSAFLMRFVKNYNDCLICNREMFGYNVMKFFAGITLYIVPMINPDGVDIALNGLDITNEWHRKLISMVGIHSFGKVWQSNANAVDLNHNYDAEWKMTVEKPSPSKFGGENAFDQPETKQFAEFIREIGCDMLLCFHSQGKEIYYDFNGLENDVSRSIAKDLSEVSGYNVGEAKGTAAYGGCKDWFIKEFGSPGFTIEMGKGVNPITTEKLDEFYEENAKIILESMKNLV